MNAPLRPTDLVHLPLEIRLQLNGALKGGRDATMLGRIVTPRSSFDDTCRPPADPVIQALMGPEDVGAFLVTGLAQGLALGLPD